MRRTTRVGLAAVVITAGVLGAVAAGWRREIADTIAVRACLSARYPSDMVVFRTPPTTQATAGLRVANDPRPYEYFVPDCWRHFYDNSWAIAYIGERKEQDTGRSRLVVIRVVPWQLGRPDNPCIELHASSIVPDYRSIRSSWVAKHFAKFMVPTSEPVEFSFGQADPTNSSVLRIPFRAAGAKGLVTGTLRSDGCRLEIEGGTAGNARESYWFAPGYVRPD